MMRCRHCRQSFEPRPDKKGFTNECPQCEGQRYTEAPSYGMRCRSVDLLHTFEIAL